MLTVYADRDTFLNALLNSLNRARGSKIAFGKYSPAPLPSNSSIMCALRRLIDEGSELLLLIRQPRLEDEWIASVRELLNNDRADIAVFAQDCPYFPPAVVIDETEVFLHISWSSDVAPNNPYLGIHVNGAGVELLAKTLRRSLEVAARSCR